MDDFEKFCKHASFFIWYKFFYMYMEAYLIVGSLLLWQYVFNDGQVDFERLKELTDTVGKQRLVLDLSCRKKVSLTHITYVSPTKAF